MQSNYQTSNNSNWSNWSLSKRYRAPGQNRPIRLRTRNWGNQSEFGWSKFNRSLYYDMASWEPKNVVLEELRAQRGLNRGLDNFSSLPATTFAPSSLPVQSLPVQSLPVQAAPASIVPVNMLPAPINSGAKYEKLIGSKRGSNRYRKHLKQPLAPLSASPLNNMSGLNTALPASVLPGLQQGWAVPMTNQQAKGKVPFNLSRKAHKRALARQNQFNTQPQFLNSGLPLQNQGLATSGLPLASGAPLTQLGTATTYSGLPIAGGVPTTAKTSNRKARKAAKRAQRNGSLNNNLALNNNLTGLNNGFIAGAPLPSGIPAVSNVPLTNVAGAPILVQSAPATSISTTPTASFAPSMVKTEQYSTIRPVTGMAAF